MAGFMRPSAGERILFYRPGFSQGRGGVSAGIFFCLLFPSFTGSAGVLARQSQLFQPEFKQRTQTNQTTESAGEDARAPGEAIKIKENGMAYPQLQRFNPHHDLKKMIVRIDVAQGEIE